MKIFSYIGVADYVTIINGLLGFLAIMYIIDTNYRMAFIILLVVIILDGLDGIIARYLKSGKELGKYLDSISDTLSFSFGPAVLIYTIFYLPNHTSFNYWPNALVVFTCLIIVGFGMLRLAWFVEYGQKLEHFRGLPTPALALFVLLLLQPEIQVFISLPVSLCAFLLIALLTVADIDFPKFNNTFMLTVGGSMVLMMILNLAFQFPPFISNIVVFSTLGLLLSYMTLGPVMIRMQPHQ
jgi:CDP-diacylglycerol--serine O-phosphatidyltransferase